MLRVGGRFARVEPRRRIAGFVRGLLAGLPQVNCWSIAEHAGEEHPRGMQRLLSAAVWDDAGMRADRMRPEFPSRQPFSDANWVFLMRGQSDRRPRAALGPYLEVRAAPL
jgi:hypothetical protein